MCFPKKLTDLLEFVQVIFPCISELYYDHQFDIGRVDNKLHRLPLIVSIKDLTGALAAGPSSDRFSHIVASYKILQPVI